MTEPMGISKISLFFTFVFAIMLFACSNRDKTKVEKSESDLRKIALEFKHKALLHGDKIAFKQFIEYAGPAGMGDEVLTVSLEVANRFKLPEAYYAIYTYSSMIPKKYPDFTIDTSNIDYKVREFGFYNLRKAAELGCLEAQLNLIRCYRYGEFCKIDLTKVDSLEKLIRIKNPDYLKMTY
jgi:hypothetical protein